MSSLVSVTGASGNAFIHDEHDADCPGPERNRLGLRRACKAARTAAWPAQRAGHGAR